MPQDQIRIRGLAIFAHHGVYPEEKQKGQTFIVNATLCTNLEQAGRSDDLSRTTHYGEVCEALYQSLTEHNFDLIEAAAEKAAEDVLLRFLRVDQVTLELEKPQAPIKREFDTVSVCITRGWHKAYIAFGSNAGNPREQVEQALAKIEGNPYFRGLRVSDYYRTLPYGGVPQEDFLNGVLEVRTLLSPRRLLDCLQGLENEAGRVRTLRWGPRPLDLDILLYDEEVIDEADLQIPHRDMANRDFVLVPLAQLAPFFRHPVCQKSIEELRDKVKTTQIKGKENRRQSK